MRWMRSIECLGCLVSVGCDGCGAERCHLSVWPVVLTKVGVSVLQVVLLAQVCSSAPPRLHPNCLRFWTMSHQVGRLQELSGELLSSV